RVAQPVPGERVAVAVADYATVGVILKFDARGAVGRRLVGLDHPREAPRRVVAVTAVDAVFLGVAVARGLGQLHAHQPAVGVVLVHHVAGFARFGLPDAVDQPGDAAAGVVLELPAEAAVVGDRRQTVVGVVLQADAVAVAVGDRRELAVRVEVEPRAIGAPQADRLGLLVPGCIDVHAGRRAEGALVLHEDVQEAIGVVPQQVAGFGVSPGRLQILAGPAFPERAVILHVAAVDAAHAQAHPAAGGNKVELRVGERAVGQ